MINAPRMIIDGVTFPETPRWHAGRNAWYFVDIDEGQVFELKDFTSSPRLLYRFNALISGVTFDDHDGFFVTTNRGEVPASIQHLTGALTGNPQTRQIADLSDRAVILNDMIRGPSGHLYVGAINFDAIGWFQDPTTPTHPGRVHKVNTEDGTIVDIEGDVFFPNGLIITPDQKNLLMADSFNNRIVKWPLKADGSVGEMAVWAQFGKEDIVDGMTMDAEGALWIATGHRLIRSLPGGKITNEIHIDGLHISACMLGGQNGTSLLITGAASIDRRIIRTQKTGKLYALEVDVPGCALPSLYKK